LQSRIGGTALLTNSIAHALGCAASENTPLGAFAGGSPFA